RPVQHGGGRRAVEMELESDLAVLEGLEIVQAVDDLLGLVGPRVLGGSDRDDRAIGSQLNRDNPANLVSGAQNVVGLDVIREAAGQPLEFERESVTGVGGHPLAADITLAIVDNKDGRCRQSSAIAEYASVS